MPATLQAPTITNQPLPNHFGRGRPNGLKPHIMVMHIQEGYGNLWSYFHGQGDDGPNAADSTLWNPRADNAQLVRYLRDEDTAWTNGRWTEPVNHQNLVLENLFKQNTDANDVALTIEHEGHPGEGITEAQLQRTAAICAYWSQTWNIPADRQHIVGHYEIGPHKLCPGSLYPFDRLVAKVQQILGGTGNIQAHSATPNGTSSNGFNSIPISYRVVVPAGQAVVRGGPGRSYAGVTSLDADPNKQYQVDAEAHGEMILSDDVWSHLAEVGGWVTRTALQIVH